jgi:hypothetical protein
MHKLGLSIALALSLAFGSACNHNVQAPIPGAVNQFDSDTYLSLVAAKASIDQTKAELASGAFSPAVAATVKEAVNYAVASYNVADITYQAYHTAALAGNATPAQQAEVNRAVSNLNITVANITPAKGGK